MPHSLPSPSEWHMSLNLAKNSDCFRSIHTALGTEKWEIQNETIIIIMTSGAHQHTQRNSLLWGLQKRKLISFVLPKSCKMKSFVMSALTESRDAVNLITWARALKEFCCLNSRAGSKHKHTKVYEPNRCKMKLSPTGIHGIFTLRDWHILNETHAHS